MLPLVALLSLALIPSVTAQAVDTGIQLAAIKAHFSAAGLVPDLLPTFEPSALLAISYSGVGDVPPGKALTRARTQSSPKTF